MKNQFLSDNYIRQMLRKYRVKNGRDPRYVLIHPSDIHDLESIYHTTTPIYSNGYLYGIMVADDDTVTKDTIRLI